MTQSRKKSLYIKHFIIFVGIIEDLERNYTEKHVTMYYLLAPSPSSFSPPHPSSLAQAKLSCSILSKAMHSGHLASQFPPTMICQEISLEKVTALTLNKIPLKIIFPNN